MHGLVITVAQQKGGAGKTTVAAHLAVALQQKGNRVAVIDIDPQGSLTCWHKARTKRLGEGYTGLTFATLSGWRIGSEVARLRKTHDYIIIDSPPHTETEARSAIRSADMLVVPVQPSPTDLWATKATLDLARAEKIPTKILLNRMSAHSRLGQTIASQLTSLAHSTLGNRVLFASSLMEGATATEVEPNSLAALEVKELVQELLADLHPEPEEAPRSKSRGKTLEPA